MQWFHTPQGDPRLNYGASINKNLIQVGKKDTQVREEERGDQAAYMSLNENLIEPLMDCEIY